MSEYAEYPKAVGQFLARDAGEEAAILAAIAPPPDVVETEPEPEPEAPRRGRKPKESA